MASTGPKGPRAAAELLDELHADRARLAQHARIPGWLAPAIGLIAAIWVATPALPGEGTGAVASTTGVVLGAVLVALASRATGIKFSRFGADAWVAFAAAVAGTLLLFSVSLGLAASGLTGWIAVSAAASFAMVFGLTRLIFLTMRKRLSRVG